MSFETTVIYTPDEFSMSSRTRFFQCHQAKNFERKTVIEQIFGSKGQILPVAASAFEDDDIMPGWADDKVRCYTGYRTIRDFYQSLGIKIIDPYKNWPGWHHCILPSGWRIVTCTDLCHNQQNLFSDRTSGHANGIIIGNDGKPHFGITAKNVPRYPLAVTIITDPQYLSYNLKYPLKI